MEISCTFTASSISHLWRPFIHTGTTIMQLLSAALTDRGRTWLAGDTHPQMGRPATVGGLVSVDRNWHGSIGARPAVPARTFAPSHCGKEVTGAERDGRLWWHLRDERASGLGGQPRTPVPSGWLMSQRISSADAGHPPRRYGDQWLSLRVQEDEATIQTHGRRPLSPPLADAKT